MRVFGAPLNCKLWAVKKEGMGCLVGSRLKSSLQDTTGVAPDNGVSKP